MNNRTIINTFNSDNNNNNNIADIDTLQCHCQIMTIIAYRIFKFESIIKKLIMANHAFLAVVTFSNINSFLISILL